jgi:integrase
MIAKLEEKKKSSRKPYPMSRHKRSILFGELPAHLQTMALFKVSTGCREEEVCKLRWGCEIPVPELSTPAAGVTEEDRKALLGYKNGSITSHYSGAELGHLIEAANMVSATDSRGPVLTILKRRQA